MDYIGKNLLLISGYIQHLITSLYTSRVCFRLKPLAASKGGTWNDTWKKYWMLELLLCQVGETEEVPLNFELQKYDTKWRIFLDVRLNVYFYKSVLSVFELKYTEL